MADIKLDGLTVASSSGSPTAISLNSAVDIKANLNATGDAPVYACRAWVNFNGALDENQLSLTTGENVYIRDAGNVSSVYFNGTGSYTVNLATAMPDANYTVTATTGGSNVRHNAVVRTFTTSSFDITVLHVIDNTREDDSIVCASIFR